MRLPSGGPRRTARCLEWSSGRLFLLDVLSCAPRNMMLAGRASGALPTWDAAFSELQDAPAVRATGHWRRLIQSALPGEERHQPKARLSRLQKPPPHGRYAEIVERRPRRRRERPWRAWVKPSGEARRMSLADRRASHRIFARSHIAGVTHPPPPEKKIKKKQRCKAC